MDFRDVIEAVKWIEASKHVVNKQQTSRFRVIILIYCIIKIVYKTVERTVRKLINSQSKLDRECS